jgi:uridine phosphorylase
METFHLFHLASCWRSQDTGSNPVAVLSTTPDISAKQNEPSASKPAIKAAAAQLVFASRTSQAFITPQHVAELEAWTGRGILDAIGTFEIKNEVRWFYLTGQLP